MEIKLDVCDYQFARMVAQDLLWHAEHTDEKKDRYALLRVAYYYMTHDEIAEYKGVEV